MDEKKFKEIAMEVQEEWKMGGLAGTMYEDYAFEIAKRYMSDKKKEKMITVSYWVESTWPYSIDKKIDGGKIETTEVPLSKTFIKNNKRYYRMTSGHGIYTDLLIENNYG